MTFIPRKEESNFELIEKKVCKVNCAINLMATKNFVDRDGIARKNGEFYYYSTVGSFIPGEWEKFISYVQGKTLTDKLALHMMAIEDFTDKFGKIRKAGEKWLVTSKMTQVYIPTVQETL